MRAAPGATEPDLPVAYRSNRLRLLVVVAALALVALSFVFWVALPANLKAEFTLSQAVTLLLILGLFVAALLVVGNGVVRADADGLCVRNGLRVHQVCVVPGAPDRDATRRRLGLRALRPQRSPGGGRGRSRPPDADGHPDGRRALRHRGRRRPQSACEGVPPATSSLILRCAQGRSTARPPGSRTD